MAAITVEELKAHLNIVADDENALLAEKIEAAEGWIAAFTGVPRACRSKTPAAIREASRQLAAHFYENREAVTVGIQAEEIPFGVHELIAPFRNWSF